MAEQTEEIKAPPRMLTISAGPTEVTANFTQRARTISVRTDDDVWIAFDTTSTTADPSIFLKNGEVLNIRDCNFRTIHAITTAVATTIRITYQYI